MSTDEGNVQKEDTLSESTTEDNADEGTENAVSEDYVKSHPLYEEAKQREAGARKKMDEATIEAKALRKENERLRKLALGEEVEEEEPEKEPTASVDEAYIDWRHDNSDKIDLVKDEYAQELENLREMGVQLNIKARDMALNLALQKKGITSENMSNSQVSPDAKTDRSDAKKVPSEIREDMKKWGYSEETYLKHKDTVLGKR